MRYNHAICDLSPGNSVEGFYLLKSVYSKVSSNGKPFLSAVLSDLTGSIDAKVWDYAGPIGVKEDGSVVKIKGTVTEFRGAPQVNVDSIRLADEQDDYDLSQLLPVAPLEVMDAVAEIDAFLDNMEDGDYRRVCKKMMERHREAFLKMPAAKSVHHAFLSGLLMHTLNMMKTADFLSGLYEEVVDRDLLLAGTFLHDFAKEQEFLFSQLGLVTGYSVKGELLGHLVMGAQEIAQVAGELGVSEEKTILLQHLILSHHGEPEFGAAVKPICAEAELLSLIDKVDSRMEIYRENLKELNEGELSGRIFALDKRIYRHK